MLNYSAPARHEEAAKRIRAAHCLFYLIVIIKLPHVICIPEFWTHISMIKGFGDMLQLLTMLLVTFVLKEVCGRMGMTEFIINIAKPFLFPAIFPACVFILGAALAFTTGSDWGMSSIITPIVFPLGFALNVNPILIMAAIISGGTFGSHACFYADATLLASQSAGVDSMEHALTQLPYVLIACILSIAGFLIAGFLI